MELRQLIIALISVAVVILPLGSVQSMEVNIGNIRVQTAPNGELFVDTPRGRIYFPPEDDYYEAGDYYEGDYDDDYYYDDYCAGGRRVVQRTVQRSSGSRQESYSSVYSGC